MLPEFKSMVKALHEAGIEVILDVVYNHTTESGEDGPTYSFRGIDNSTYYCLRRPIAIPQRFWNRKRVALWKPLRSDHDSR